MMPDWVKAEAKFLLVLGAAALIFAAGWAVEGWRMEAEISAKDADLARAEKAAAEAVQDRLASAIKRSDELQTALAEHRLLIDQLTEEKNDAVKRLTVGRPCLDGAVVRVLNTRMQSGIKPGGAITQTASEPLSADGAFASDTDVGLWIGQCQRAYDTCRGRIQAISDFYATEAE